MDTPDYSHQATISALHAEIDGKDKIIEEYQKQVQTLNDRAIANYNALSDLQYAIKYFFEAHREDDNFEFDISEANEFLLLNGMDGLKREYRVQFRIEGTIVVEAENEEEAEQAVQEIDLSHYTCDIESYEAEAIGIDTQF
jgi:hypothetical protein